MQFIPSSIYQISFNSSGRVVLSSLHKAHWIFRHLCDIFDLVCHELEINEEVMLTLSRGAFWTP